MEGNEVEKVLNYRAYSKSMIARMDSHFSIWRLDTPSLENVLTAMCETVAGHKEAELTRTSKELDAMTTKYNELSRKYDDLYRKQKP